MNANPIAVYILVPVWWAVVWLAIRMTPPDEKGRHTTLGK